MKKNGSYRKLHMESLEERALMAVVSGTESHVAAAVAPMATEGGKEWYVNVTYDQVSWKTNDSIISLREAVSRASAGDTIKFADSLAGKTLCLTSGYGFTISKKITIDGDNRGITIKATEKQRSVSSCLRDSNSIEIRNLNFSGISFYQLNGTAKIVNCSFKDSNIGGITNRGGTMSLTGCTISGNSGDFGGVRNSGTMTIKNCTITGNKSSGVQGVSGGGISNSGDIIIDHCTITGNTAASNCPYGGGVYNRGTANIINNTVISRNSAKKGGGIFNASGAALTVKDCSVSSNYNTMFGGGIYSDMNSNMTISNCSIASNIADYGGGIYAEYSKNVLWNCAITQNTSNQDGGGVYYHGSTLKLTNCTVAGNKAKQGNGGGFFANERNDVPKLNLYNSIVVGNNAKGSSNDIYRCNVHTADLTLNAYNTISSFTAWTAKSNAFSYSASALFINPSNGDYTLKAGSPAINKGNNSYISVNSYPKDLAGKTRIAGGSVDIGAYEYQGTPPVSKPDLKVLSAGSVSNPTTVITFSVGQIKNIGNAASGSYTVTFYASADSTINKNDIVLGSYSASGISVNGQANVQTKSFSVSGLTAGKTYYFGWIIETGNDSNSSNNTANCGAKTIPVAKSTDIAYGKIGTLSAVANNKFSISGATVKNGGQTNIKGGYAVFVFASPDITVNGTGNDIHLMTTSSTPALNAGANAPLRLDNIPTSNLTPGKTYYIGWIVNRVDGEKDSQLANNFATCTTKLTVPAVSPDLKANNGGSVTASSKGKFTLKLGLIENLGGKQAASGWQVKIYACPDTKFAASNTICLGTKTMSNSILAGNSRELKVKDIDSSKLKSGTSYYFKWEIINVKNETNKGNNTARTTKKFKVTNGVVASNAQLPSAVNSKSAIDSVFDDYSTADMLVDLGAF
ncbi:MAG: right-handed parallel beta-helix repeat-containing protein [Thermoguttaceae bacterium]|nr:right-handed parallel beta-helix repeat-containing protein [Thermoguttaceae bacterium]